MVVRGGDLLDVSSLDYQASVSPVLPTIVASERFPNRRLYYDGHQRLLHHHQLDAGVLAMQTIGCHDPPRSVSQRSVS